MPAMVHRRIFRKVCPPSFLRHAEDSLLQAGFGMNFYALTLLNVRGLEIGDLGGVWGTRPRRSGDEPVYTYPEPTSGSSRVSAG
jgi:hypothetical protein